jgi:hypothetical protein
MNRSFWLGWTVAFGIFIILIIVLKVVKFSGLIQNSSEAAAWVQAVGSIATIIGAAWFPYMHEKSKKKENKITIIKNIIIETMKLPEIIKNDIKLFELGVADKIRCPIFLNDEKIIEIADIDYALSVDCRELVNFIEKLNDYLMKCRAESRSLTNRGISPERIEGVVNELTEKILVTAQAL